MNLTNPKQIIEFNKNSPYPKNTEGIRQENSEIALNMSDQDSINLNMILKKKYSPENHYQPIKEDAIKQED